MKGFGLFIVLVVLSLGFRPQDVAVERSRAEEAVKGFYSALEKQNFQRLRQFCTPTFHALDEGKMLNSLDEMIEKAKVIAAYAPKFQLEFIKTDRGSDMALSVVKLNVAYKKDRFQENQKTIQSYLLKKVQGKWLIDFYHSSPLTNARSLEKGNVLGIHLLSGIEMKPRVTHAQVEDFIFHRFVPAFNSLTDEIQVIPLRGLRGENKAKLGFIMFFASDTVRNSFWSDEGVLTPKGQAVFNKLEPVLTEQDKLFINSSDPYTEWKVE